MRLKRYVRKAVSVGCACTMVISLNMWNGLFVGQQVTVKAEELSEEGIVVDSSVLEEAAESGTDASTDIGTGISTDQVVDTVVNALQNNEDKADAGEEVLGELPALTSSTVDLESGAVSDSEPVDSFSVLSSQMPASYDLRDLGVVTPVKSQYPFATCWGFASIAAAETSILSETGKTYAETGLDLSEHQMAWFAAKHLPLDGSSQAGEGTYLPSGSEMNVGFMWYATSAFASGTGPVTEEMCPYSGVNKQVLSANGQPICYSNADDWSVDESLRFQQLYQLEESAMLPSPVKRNTNSFVYEGYDQTGTDAIKEEILRGRGVAISFAADASAPGQVVTTTYMNQETYAHYTYDDSKPNHAVTIVGWDDNYSKENFNDHSTDAGGDGSAHQPEADGAWIVKNSWGAETEDFPNIGPWGIKDENGKSTGYFYISYYDHSLYLPESYDFYTEGEEAAKGSIANQYDYMMTMTASAILFSEETQMANVYTTEADQLLRSVGTQTAEAGTTVKFSVYLLKDEAQSPTDGTLVATAENRYRYAGFHRQNLADEVFLKKGQKYSIVVEQAVTPGNNTMYEIHCAADRNEKGAQQENGARYSKGVVNQGESFFCTAGKWVDWSDVTSVLSQGTRDYDNFSIKGYSDPSELQGLNYDGEGWHYYKDGVIDKNYEGFAVNAYGWWYMKNGEIQFDYTGLMQVEEDQSVRYINHGLWEKNYTGMACDQDGVWHYFTDGTLNTGYTGMAFNEYGFWYFSNGSLIWDYDGYGILVSSGKSAIYVFENGTVDTTFVGLKYRDIRTISPVQTSDPIYRWIYVKDGIMQLEYTGIAENETGWWYVSQGIANLEYTGMVDTETGWRYVKKGAVDFEYTGMADNKYGWWYMKNGAVDFAYTGLAYNQYGGWYFENGQINFGYTGLTLNETGWWYVEAGCINTGYTGMAENQYGWWHVENGCVNTEYTGMDVNQYGWWYFENGLINFGYTGLAENEYGRWYFENGQINFGYTGPYTFHGVTYKVVNGHVE